MEQLVCYLIVWLEIWTPGFAETVTLYFAALRLSAPLSPVVARCHRGNECSIYFHSATRRMDDASPKRWETHSDHPRDVVFSTTQTFNKSLRYVDILLPIGHVIYQHDSMYDVDRFAIL